MNDGFDMSRKFDVGQKVRCIYHTTGLVAGRHYTVKRINPGAFMGHYDTVLVEDAEGKWPCSTHDGGYFSARFEPVR